MTPGKGINKLTSPYGPRSFDGFHYGQDLVITGPARAIWDCSKVETVAGYNGGRGNTAYLYYSPSLRVLYQHLASILVKPGQKVKQGQEVGIMGYSGYCIPAGPAGAHLHIEVQKLSGGRWRPIDPTPYTEVPNVKGTHKGNDKLDTAPAGAQEAPLAPEAPLYKLNVGPASAGDVATLRQMAETLRVGFESLPQGGNLSLLTLGPVSTGDKHSLLRLADTLNLPAGVA